MGNHLKGKSKIDDTTPFSQLPIKKRPVKDPIRIRIAPFNLLISNLEARDLDAPPTNNDGFRVGPFRARFWTEPGDEIIRWTNTDGYGLSPIWPGTTKIRFDTIEPGFLFVEIVGRGIEPCSSDFESVIGRAKIPLPDEDVGVKMRSYCELVRSDGGECWIGVGHVLVTMKWEINLAAGGTI